MNTLKNILALVIIGLIVWATAWAVGGIIEAWR